MHRRAAFAASGAGALLAAVAGSGVATEHQTPARTFTVLSHAYDDARPPPGSDVRWLTDHYYEAVTTTTEAPPPTTEPPTTEPATTVPATVVRTTSPATTPATAPAAPRATTALTTAPRAPTGGSGACGGDLPPCYVMNRESGGNPQAYNAGGCYDGNPKSPGYGTTGCFGKWQFMRATFWGLGYTGVATDYPEATQDEAARTLWASGAGCSAWGAC